MRGQKDLRGYSVTLNELAPITLPPSPPFTPTKARAGMPCTAAGIRAGSITASHSRTRAFAPIRRKAISAAYAVQRLGRITTSRAATLAHTLAKWHGARITATVRTVINSGCLRMPCRRRVCRAPGKGIGSGRRRKNSILAKSLKLTRSKSLILVDFLCDTL